MFFPFWWRPHQFFHVFWAFYQVEKKTNDMFFLFSKRILLPRVSGRRYGLMVPPFDHDFPPPNSSNPGITDQVPNLKKGQKSNIQRPGKSWGHRLTHSVRQVNQANTADTDRPETQIILGAHWQNELCIIWDLKGSFTHCDSCIKNARAGHSRCKPDSIQFGSTVYLSVVWMIMK